MRKKSASRVIAAVMAAALCVFALLSAPAGVLAADRTTPSGIAYGDIGDRIDEYISEREEGLASCEVSVFDADGIIFTGRYGFSDIENGTAADETTVYEWGSCSKLLVWISVMQQRERGNIDLEADIREYLPVGFLTKLRYPEEKITMLNLMSHNAGFQESFYENQSASPDDLYDTLEDAVRACECYQAYHAGEYTAYSNWGTALAAYIVERVSGEDYVSYVNDNIFSPLGMTRTSIDPKQRDNAYVAEARMKLKCYSRYADPKYNEDYGVCLYGVQLFPAGAAVGTLDDMTRFARAFVSAECPLFENPGTRDEMFGATSYYGASDIAKTCHGLWTSQYLVSTLGHGGNTAGCSSNIEFDPESGLGIVIMTNEQGETAFNYGIPSLLFGSVRDRAGIKDAVITDDTDISGFYTAKRNIVSGAAMASYFTGSVMPLGSDGDGGYSVRMFGIKMGDGKLERIADDMYVMDTNGMSMFMYGSETPDGGFRLEMMSTDYVLDNGAGAKLVVCLLFVGFGIVCIAVLLIKLAACVIGKLRRTGRRYTAAQKSVLAQQLIYGASGVIFFLFISVIGSEIRGFTTVSAVLAALLACFSVFNGITLLGGALKEYKDDRRFGTLVKNAAWALLCAAYAVFIIYFQLYNFITL